MAAMAPDASYLSNETPRGKECSCFCFFCRRLATILAADASSAKPAKRPPKLTRTQVSHAPVVQHQLPADGAVVLKLLLQPQATLDAAAQASAAAAAAAAGVAGATPDKSSSSSAAAAAAAGKAAGEQQHQQQQREVMRVVGKGKAALRYWLMSAKITPWSNEDSLAAWAAAGAEIQQQQQQGVASGLAAADGAAAGGVEGSGLSVSVDGQQIESLEALLRQLLEANRQQDAAAGVAAGDK
jgi:hypothetical protein